MKSIGPNVQELRNLNRRVGLHQYIPVPYWICQAQNRTLRARSESHECAAKKSISAISFFLAFTHFADCGFEIMRCVRFQNALGQEFDKLG